MKRKIPLLKEYKKENIMNKKFISLVREDDYEDEIPPFCNQYFINCSFNDVNTAINQIDSFIKNNNFNKNYKFMLDGKEHNLLSYFFENKAPAEIIRYLVNKNFTLKHLNEKRLNALTNKIWEPVKRENGELENVEHFLLLISSAGFNEYDKNIIGSYPVLLNHLYSNNIRERDFYFDLLLPALFESYYFSDKPTSMFVMNLLKNDDIYLMDKYIDSPKKMIGILKSYTSAIDDDYNIEEAKCNIFKFMDYYFPEFDSNILTYFLEDFYYIPISFHSRHNKIQLSEKEIMLNKSVIDYIIQFDSDYFFEVISRHLVYISENMDTRVTPVPVEIMALEYYKEVSSINKQKSILNDIIKVNDSEKSKGKERL